jgi:hypothetical protein
MARLKTEMGYKLDETALAQINATPPAGPAGAGMPIGIPAPNPPGAPPPTTK